MATVGECVPVEVVDPDAVADLADKLEADLVVVGPEDALVAGVADALALATGACSDHRRRRQPSRARRRG